jgi:hypothetical protein
VLVYQDHITSNHRGLAAALAEGHFIVRRLERLYGPALVRRHYEELGSPLARTGT